MISQFFMEHKHKTEYSTSTLNALSFHNKLKSEQQVLLVLLKNKETKLSLQE